MDTNLYGSVRLPLGISDSIRLLEIIDADEDKPIECKLHLVSLGDLHVQYIALSYMWGTEAATEVITINGTEIEIRSNLRDFLRQRRIDRRGVSVDEPKFLWVDALCINQMSSSERNHQVAIMGKIYVRAHKVLIWLGAEPISSVLEGMRMLAGYQESKASSLSDHATASHLRAVLKQPYWSRAWIVQECVLARQLDLQFDQIMVPSLELSLIVGFLESILSSLRERTQDSSIDTRRRLRGEIQSIEETLDKCNSPKFLSSHGAIPVLQARRDWKMHQHGLVPWGPATKLNCSDARDKIYSRLAIMDSSIEIEPDYDKFVEQLFLDIVLQCQDRMDKMHVFFLFFSLGLYSRSVYELRPLQDQELRLGMENSVFIKDGKFVGDETALSDTMRTCLWYLGLVGSRKRE